jgi:signal transduction histidine kinase
VPGARSANTRLARLAEEQAALRRVATLVARGVPAAQLFAAVTEEVGQLLPVEFALMGRYDVDDTITSIAAWGSPLAHFPLGRRWSLGGNNLATTVHATGRPGRVDHADGTSGSIGAVGRGSGFRSTVGAPIVVEGRVWGAMTVGSTRAGPPLPLGIEERLAQFTDLLATAIANAESRAGLARLAEEQAALRRVATLVARGVPQEELFAAVTEEVGRLLGVECAIMNRYEPDGTITMIAGWGDPLAGFPVGYRASIGGKNIITLVHQTGRPARIDNYADSSSGSIGAVGRESGFSSAVGAPIVVEGRLWGLVAVSSTMPQPSLSTDTEARLASFTELVATAIANAQSRGQLIASRARIVAAADESRRRIERDLHDGAQQRLVHAVIVLRLALEARGEVDPGARVLLVEALDHAEQAVLELRELAHGILPSALTHDGLQGGIEALVSRLPLSVSVEVPVERFPPSVEATAYFIVSEALTNVVKHAHANHAAVTAQVEDGALRVEIRDDGIGGARAGHNSGLCGLEDRVSALAGQLVVESYPGEGTLLYALLPVSAQD